MVLIVGGLGAGKRTYLKEVLGFAEADIADGVLDGSPVLYGLEAYIRQNGAVGDDVLDALLQKDAVACCEVGCGVVPIDAEERKWRDDVGRACARLAAKTPTVVRMVCGVPQIIKGEAPCR